MGNGKESKRPKSRKERRRIPREGERFGGPEEDRPEGKRFKTEKLEKNLRIRSLDDLDSEESEEEGHEEY